MAFLIGWVLVGVVGSSGFLGFSAVCCRGCVRCACDAVYVVDCFWFLVVDYFGVLGASFVWSVVILVHKNDLGCGKPASASGGANFEVWGFPA